MPAEPRATRDQAPVDLPAWLWLGLPLLLVGVQVLFRLGADDATYDRWMDGEFGVPENGTVLWLWIAAATGAVMLAKRGSLPSRRLATFLALLSLGAFVWGGEEMSWGQHFFGWTTPEAIAEINYKDETNVHNMSELWFDYVPRWIMMSGIVAGGVVAPIVTWLRPGALGANSKLAWFVPTYVCTPTALLAIGVGEIERVFRALGRETPHVLRLHDGEVREYFIAMFVLLYVLSLRSRTRAARGAVR